MPPSSGDPPPKDELRQQAKAFLDSLPKPDLSQDGNEIRLWYGDASNPVLELDPIPLSGVI